MIAPWFIAAFTVIAVIFLDRWENKHIKSLFDWVPAILLAYIIPAIISLILNVDYSQADIHDFSRDYFIPLAIIAVMSSLSLGQLKSIGWRPIAVFAAGSAFIAIFPVLLGIGLLETELVSETLLAGEYWKGIPPIVGSWIGGSTSQLVLKELVDCPENIFLSVLVMDNILVNIWTILMFQSIKKSDYLNKRFNISDISMPEDIRREATKTLPSWICFMILIASGKQLRTWLGVTDEVFYEATKIALVPMGFCYPGKGKSGDLPPRPECAPLWHAGLLNKMPNLKMIVVIGTYAQKYYLKGRAHKNLTETVKAYQEYVPSYFPLPHPSPRNRFWLSKNPWFEKEVVPDLRKLIKGVIAS